MRSLHYLNGGTLSPFPAEPEQKQPLRPAKIDLPEFSRPEDMQFLLTI